MIVGASKLPHLLLMVVKIEVSLETVNVEELVSVVGVVDGVGVEAEITKFGLFYQL